MEAPKLESISETSIQRREREVTADDKRKKMLEERRKRERERARILRATETPEEAASRREKSALRARKNRALKKLKTQLSSFVEEGLGAQDVLQSLIQVEDLNHSISKSENVTNDIEDNTSLNENIKLEPVDYFDENNGNEVPDVTKEQCPECGTVILRRSLYRHLKTVHKYSENVVSEFKQKLHAKYAKMKCRHSCNEQFTSEYRLKNHIKLMHAEKIIFKEPEKKIEIMPEPVITNYINTTKPPQVTDWCKSYPNGIIPTVPFDDVLMDMLSWPVNVEI